MKKKIVRSMAAVLALGLLLCTLVAAFVFEEKITDHTEQEMTRLVSSAAFEAELLPGRGAADAEKLAAAADGVRVTFIGADGTVTGDSAASAAAMENHAGREEVAEARSARYGVAVRRSVTTGRNMMYVATRLSDGSFVRVASDYPSALAGFVGFLPGTLAAAAVAFVIALVLGGRFARSISGPIEEFSDSLKLVKSGGARLDPARYGYAELQDMAADINHISAEIDDSLRTLEGERERIDYVLDNMSEGLILLDTEENVLLINRAACAFLGCEKSVTGRNVVYATRSVPFIEGIDGAVKENRAARVELPLSSGQLIEAALSPVTGPDGEHRGAEAAIAVLSDVTIHKNAVRMRQEFFSNASHELKTPITSILGFAELLCSTPEPAEEQRREFARRIRKEAGTMQNLISDIIMISRLEAGDITFEREVLDLAEVVRDCCADVRPLADQRGTSVVCQADRAVLSASRKEMQELAGNLIQNAVRYSAEGSAVDVRLSAENGAIRLAVHNTGSYIDPQYRQRVFERFYRIDKGRSKAMGGTGLGLAIVKHVAGQYGAALELDSTREQGTTFTVTFPPASPR